MSNYNNTEMKLDDGPSYAIGYIILLAYTYRLHLRAILIIDLLLASLNQGGTARSVNLKNC